MKKVKGFTILEMMLVLALAGIFLILTSRLTGMLEKVTGNSRRQIEDAASLLILHGILKHDIVTCQQATISASSIELISHNNARIYYRFSPTTITRRRNNEQEATFHAGSVDKSGYFRSRLITEGRIDELNLRMTTSSDTLFFAFSKIYSFEQLRGGNDGI